MNGAQLKTRRWVLLVFLHLLAVAWGAQMAFSNEPRLVELLLAWVAALALVMCCVADAKIVGKPILHIVQFIMLFTWPVTAPVYLVWARGWRGLLWAAGFAASLTIVSLVSRLLVLLIQRAFA